MKAISLFSGIGGIDLAMERAGIQPAVMCEIDKHCREVLHWHWPDTPVLHDVKDVSYDLIGDDFDILTAGWPCQGNSVAGHRKGMDDPRSGLWSEVARMLGELQPKWFAGENVPGLLSVNGGRDFLAVLRSLDELGYGVAWRVLDAQHFGVPQRRRRVILVGCLGDPASAAEVLFDIEGRGGDSAESGEAREGTPRASVVSTLQGGGKRGYRVDAESAAGGQLVVSGSAVRRLTPLECERLQGFPDNWTAGQSDSARYRQLGNAVAVPVLEWVMRRLVSTSNRGSA